MKKKLLCLLMLFILLPLTNSCGSKFDEEGATKIAFKDAPNYDYLWSLDGEKIEIIGYMCASSVFNGASLFLMNLPFQTCVFCKPNTNQLSNTIVVYPKKGDRFSYTTQPIKVVGTLVVAGPGQVFKTEDDYQYEFSFKIVDGDYRILKDDEMTGGTAIWGKLADAGLGNFVQDMYKLYDYVSFVTTWPEYFVNTSTDSKGVTHIGYYLYASDAINYLTKDGAQWSYGYKEGYFDQYINKLNRIKQNDTSLNENDKKSLDDITNNLVKAKELATYAVNELFAGNYTYENKFVEKFNKYDDIYTMNDTTLKSQFETLYYEFEAWIAQSEV